MSNNNAPGMPVEEGNRLIAEFMEHTGQSGEVKFYVGPDGFEHESGNYLKYHSSDDWLMPVIRKIAHWVLHTDFGSIKKLNAAIEAWKPLSNSLEKAEDIPVLHTHVLNFIRWYNTQTPQP